MKTFNAPFVFQISLLIGFISVNNSSWTDYSAYSFFQIVTMCDLVMILFFYIMHIFRVYRKLTCVSWPLAVSLGSSPRLGVDVSLSQPIFLCCLTKIGCLSLNSFLPCMQILLLLVFSSADSVTVSFSADLDLSLPSFTQI